MRSIKYRLEVILLAKESFWTQLFYSDGNNKGSNRYMICGKCGNKASINRPLPNKCNVCGSDMINGTEKKRKRRKK